LRRQVEESNHTRLEALTGPMHEFTAFDSGKDPKKMESCIAPGLIRLKKNAQVMLLKNMDSTLVNGSLGIVIGFVGEGRFTTLGSLRKRMAPNKREQVTDLDLQDILARPYPVVRFADDREIVIENDRWSMTLPGKMPKKIAGTKRGRKKKEYGEGGKSRKRGMGFFKLIIVICNPFVSFFAFRWYRASQ
jgi:hypothetical protein